MVVKRFFHFSIFFHFSFLNKNEVDLQRAKTDMRQRGSYINKNHSLNPVKIGRPDSQVALLEALYLENSFLEGNWIYHQLRKVY